ncbi:Chromatin modification-related protein YNG2 [Orchesella cincta]|uniref:Chromatin modification-related protein YNG2 n=1 Tax=Orchesella cincta TaxID=48709 RepID=A0A1D2NN35_ORCCI|nr:Chromatin modification-related protein YNG2 [Orchesella cincta]
MAESAKAKLQARPTSYNDRMEEKERVAKLPETSLIRSTAATLVGDSGQHEGHFQSCSKNTFKVKRAPSYVLQQYFSHTFDPAELKKGHKNESYACLELECKICSIKAPIEVMYTHALDTHLVNLCIYCLATFREGRQLQVHLTRSHQVQHGQFSSLEHFHRICGSSSTLFCIDCDRQVELTGNIEQDEELVTKHVCRSDEVQCVKCAKKYSLKEIGCHVELCGEKVPQPVNVLSRMPVFTVKEESQETDAEEDNEKSATDMLTEVLNESEIVAPPQIEKVEKVEQPERKPQHFLGETSRLRNRDYRCKFCHMVVPPSKHAEHGLQCTAQSQDPSQLASDARRPSLKLKFTGNHHRDSPFLKSRKPSLSSSSSLTVTTTMNGVESLCDPNDLEDDQEARLGSKIVISRKHGAAAIAAMRRLQGGSPQATPATNLPGVADIKLQSIEVDGNATPQQYTPPYSPTKVESDDTPTDTISVSGRDDDSMAVSEVEEKPQPKYGDPLLNEDDSDKRRTLLINELCDYLELKHREEYRINDNLDVRTRDVDIFHPIGTTTGDEILETMVSNACAGCTYCRQAKIVGVDRRQLVIHLLTRHTWNLKFHADAEKPSITLSSPVKEEESACVPESSVNTTDNRSSSQLNVDWRQFRLILLEKVFELTNNIFNFPSREPFGECPCECLLCGCPVNTQKLLFPHWYKTHPQTSMKCYMCHEKFLFVGALFSHICYGTPHPVIKEDKLEGTGTSLSNGGSGESNIPNQDDVDTTITLRYQCGLCDNFQMPGFFNYIVHLRTDHNTCELCLMPLADQKELQTHILKKHRLNYYCWKCRIAYSDLETFDNHMFWKHNNAGVDCKRCLNKKWLFVYHFCRPPTQFACKDCKEKFTRPMALTVHKRTHTEANLRKCPKHSCQEKFISKKLLEKHMDQVHNKVPKEYKQAEIDENEEDHDVTQDESFQEDDSEPTPIDTNAGVEDMQTDTGIDEAFAVAADILKADGTVDPSSDAMDQVDHGATSENIPNREIPNETEMQKEDDNQFPQSSSYPESNEQKAQTILTDVAQMEQLMSQPPMHSGLETEEATASQAQPTVDEQQGKTEDNEINAGEESPKRFDISEYLGPNLSEDESESEADADKSIDKEDKVAEDPPRVVPDQREPEVQPEDENIENVDDPTDFAFNLGSPDMSNYEEMMRENEEMDLDTSGVYSPSDTNSQGPPALANSPKVEPEPVGNDLRADLSLSDTDDSSDDDNDNARPAEIASSAAVDQPTSEVTGGDETKNDQPIPEIDMVDAGHIDEVKAPSPKTNEASEDQISSEVNTGIDVPAPAEPFPSEIGNFGEYNLNLEEPSVPTFEDDLLPEHIMREHALFSLEHEHDYSKKIIYNPSGSGIVQYSGSEPTEPSRLKPISAETNEENHVREYNNYPAQEGPSSTSSTFNVSHSTSGGVRITVNHSRKRSRSSSSSSTSSDSSSSGSSSESSSKSSDSDDGCDSDSYEVSPEADARNQSAQSSQYQQYRQLHTHYQNPYGDHSTASTSGNMSYTPVKRGRGRPKGSLNRDKNGLPTAKKFQMGSEGARKVGRPPTNRNTGDDSKPKRKYRKTKGKVGRPKSISTIESINLERASVMSANTFPESDLETEESDGEEVYHRRQVTEPIYDKMHSSDRIWSISNEEYLLRLLRGVDNVEKLRRDADEQTKAALSNGHDILDRQVETGKRPIAYSPQKPVHVVMKGRNFSALQERGRGGRGRRKNATASRSIGSDTDAANHRRKGSSSRTPKAPAATAIAKAKKSKEDEDNKPYCHCRQPYSDRPMIGCDFPNCPIEWYHMECIGISKPPEGSWTCPNTVCIKRRLQSGWGGSVGYSH